MYRYNVDEQETYICDTILYDKVNINIQNNNLFHLDEFNFNNQLEIIYSPIRNNNNIPGILDLTKTYGKYNNKYLYLCLPNDNKINKFLIPYTIQPTFDKSIKYLYITYKYLNWDYKYPYGTINTNIGRIENLNNYYEYMLYCKNINQPINQFNKICIKQMKNYNNLIDDICKHNNIIFRNYNIFTIDNSTSIDFDDAIGIHNDIVSIYITHVPIIINHLNIWKSFSKRISTIYLPDKKRPMIPNVITNNACSLKENTYRICLTLDIKFNNNIIIDNTFSICKIKISKNYSYEEKSLQNNHDYQKICNLFNANNSYMLISKLMTYFNEQSFNKLYKNKEGIFKHINFDVSNNEIEKFKISSSKFYSYDTNKSNYLQITSPIRRLVDLLNIYIISRKLIQFNDEANEFYNYWLNNLEYINKTMRYIRKVQYKCNLISVFDKNINEIYIGIPFDKIERNNKNYYNIYIPKLKVFTSISTNDNLIEYNEYQFKLYLFNCERNLKKKIKILLYND